jgi:curved DNA-binding protein CbpA
MSIDFNTLKYNLYTILNVSNDADNVTIKKKFMKIIKNFHPDKNTELEEEIYYHIILANQVLLNKESRKNYDLFLDPNINTFIDLKDSFNKIKDINTTPSNSNSIKEFTDKCDLLNKKHNAVLDTIKLDTESIMERLERITQERSNIKIVKEDIKNEKDFNSKFNNNKIDGKLKDQIIEYNPSSDLATYTGQENYTNIDDIDKLYVEDTIQSTKFSSLNRAFLLHPNIIEQDDKKSLDEKIKDYQKQSNIITNKKI